jgi:hypothetical protein
MSRALARRAGSGQQAEPLPAAYWTQLEHLRAPGSGERIDLVLVGPSGVHVVTDRSSTAITGDVVGGDADAGLEATAQRAAASAGAVADLLPARYRHAVTSAVCLRGDTGSAVTVGAVLAASPDVLRHVWRHQPRVLSTSEATLVGRLLRHCLEPFPVEPTAGRGRWWRRWARTIGFRR